MNEQEVTRCCECGRVIPPTEDTYECRTHSTLCEDCLKMLHKKYVSGVCSW
jgi:recombinational DNA repair protein (RecF pathway)